MSNFHGRKLQVSGDGRGFPCRLAVVSLIAMFLGSAKASEEPGQDLVSVFARAHAGAPLRAVAMGGSITQAGEGWVGGWLRGQFPKSYVTMRNAGMSATGSELGVFRLERDVLSCQPDLVFIEFAVNDGGFSDAATIRNVESLVVRLKSLAHPPAIVFLEAAAQGGSNRARHQQVARHYGLLDIDLQEALDAHLLREQLPWSTLMNDEVHPNDKGHAFYARTIADKLAPVVERARDAVRLPSAKAALPPRLSALPLLLDGQMQPLAAAPGWEGELAPPFWWGRFFLGALSATQPGSTLRIPVRGTAVGVFYGLDASYGRFYANVDGQFPVEVDCHYRGGYEYRMLGVDMEAREHLVTLVLPKDCAGPVKLGYLLVAGESGSHRDLAQQGETTVEDMFSMAFDPIPASAWEWAGPFGGKEKTAGVSPDLDTPFVAEPPDGNLGGSQAWRQLTGEEPFVDFARLTGLADRGVCYARTQISSEQAQRLHLRWTLDYFGKLWVNGKLIKTIAGAHGSAGSPIFVPISLRKGKNDILVKIQSGSLGNQFCLALQKISVSHFPPGTSK